MRPTWFLLDPTSTHDDDDDDNDDDDGHDHDDHDAFFCSQFYLSLSLLGLLTKAIEVSCVSQPPFPFREHSTSFLRAFYKSARSVELFSGWYR